MRRAAASRPIINGRKGDAVYEKEKRKSCVPRVRTEQEREENMQQGLYDIQ